MGVIDDLDALELRVEALEKRGLGLNKATPADPVQFVIPRSVKSDLIAPQTFVEFDAVTAASVSNNRVFRDAADNKLKFKDNAGVVNALY